MPCMHHARAADAVGLAPKDVRPTRAPARAPARSPKPGPGLFKLSPPLRARVLLDSSASTSRSSCLLSGSSQQHTICAESHRLSLSLISHLYHIQPNMSDTEIPKKYKVGQAACITADRYLMAHGHAHSLQAIIYDKPGEVSTKVVELDTPEPGPGEVLIRLTHSGVCHSDFGVMTNSWKILPAPTQEGQVGSPCILSGSSQDHTLTLSLARATTGRRPRGRRRHRQDGRRYRELGRQGRPAGRCQVDQRHLPHLPRLSRRTRGCLLQPEGLGVSASRSEDLVRLQFNHA